MWFFPETAHVESVMCVPAGGVSKRAVSLVAAEVGVESASPAVVTSVGPYAGRDGRVGSAGGGAGDASCDFCLASVSESKPALSKAVLCAKGPVLAVRYFAAELSAGGDISHRGLVRVSAVVHKAAIYAAVSATGGRCEHGGVEPKSLALIGIEIRNVLYDA